MRMLVFILCKWSVIWECWYLFCVNGLLYDNVGIYTVCCVLYDNVGIYTVCCVLYDNVGIYTVCCVLYDNVGIYTVCCVCTPSLTGSWWSWSYDSWIYNYLCNQCLSLLTLWVRTPFMARCTQYNIMW